MRTTRLVAIACALGVGVAPAAAHSQTDHAAAAAATAAATSTAASPVRVGYAPVHGLRMYYEIHGTGRPLVLLHGGGSTISTTFGKVLPTLAKTRRVIAVELQGHGHTADIDRPLTFEQDADDVAALLRQLGIARADIFGFSNGGNVALEMGIRHPELVHKLIVASAFFRSDGIYPAVRESFKHATPDNMPAVLRDAYNAEAPHPEHLPVLVAKLMTRLLDFKDVPPATLRAISAPTLVMLGDADIIRPEHAAEMAHLLPHSQLAIFPSSGHGAYLGEVTAPPCSYCPGAAVSMIEAFLDAPMPAGTRR